MTNKAQTLDIPGVLSRMVLAPKPITAKLSKSLNKLDQGEFFGFEAVDDQFDELQTKADQEVVRAKMAKLGFSELDFTFLAWQKKDTKLPAFMVLDLDSTEFTITVRSMIDEGIVVVDIDDDIIWSIEPTLPTALDKQYEKSIIHLAQIAMDNYDDEEIAVSAQFAGVMPSDVRKKTKSVLDSELFDNIFIICEAPKWVINKTGRTSLKDPLVVGWIEKTDQMFLIASFDPTSLEDYVLTQFKK